MLVLLEFSISTTCAELFLSHSFTKKMAPYTQVGKYILKRRIGEGAFAEVRLAVHEETREEYAVKVFDRDALPKGHFERDIKKEIKIMQHLRHPNIVSIHAVLVTERKLYLVMELVRGGELYDEIVSKRKVSERTSRRYFQQIVDAMVYCHKQGVVHRDLKPENLLLDGNGNVKITDFGMSWMKDIIDPSNNAKQLLRTQCGTPKYMAPEIIVRPPHGYDGEKLDAWECGMVLYALLAGYLPFAGEDDNAVFRSILNGKLRFPQHFSPGAKDLLSRLLEKDPEKRSSLVDIRNHFWFLTDYHGEKVQEGQDTSENVADGQLKVESEPGNDSREESNKENAHPHIDVNIAESIARTSQRISSEELHQLALPSTKKKEKVSNTELHDGGYARGVASSRERSPLSQTTMGISTKHSKATRSKGESPLSQTVLTSAHIAQSSSNQAKASCSSQNVHTRMDGNDNTELADANFNIAASSETSTQTRDSPGTSDTALKEIICHSLASKKPSRGSPRLNMRVRAENDSGRRTPRKSPLSISGIGKLASFGKIGSSAVEDEDDAPLSLRDRIRSPLAFMLKSLRSGAAQEQQSDKEDERRATWFDTSPRSIDELARRTSEAPRQRGKRSSHDDVSSSDEDVEEAADDYTERMIDPPTPSSPLKRMIGVFTRKT